MDVNAENVLGMKGELALAFGELVREMWSGSVSVMSPTLLKELMGRKAAQFVGFLQHDAQEFLSFLLDGLHEDLNRVRGRKPYAPAVEADGRADSEVAVAAWDAHCSRNDSLIVDALHGQLKSRLQCPRCDRVSITFDPYVYLPVPFPKKTRRQRLYYWPADVAAKPRKVVIEIAEDAKIGQLLEKVGTRFGVKSELLMLFESYNSKIYLSYEATGAVSEIMASDVIHVWELLDPEVVGEKVWNVTVYQRVIWHPQKSLPTRCSYCQSQESTQGETRLLACSTCYNAFYCDRECQRSAWEDNHARDCRAAARMDLVGQPFVLSMPVSQASYPKLKALAEARAMHSVEVFMPPHTHDRHLALSPSPSMDDGAGTFPTTSSTTTTGAGSKQVTETAMEVDEQTPAASSSSEQPIGGKTTLSDAWTPDAKKASPAPDSRVRLTLGEVEAQRSGGYKLFDLRALSGKEGETHYTRTNPKGQPLDKCLPQGGDKNAPLPNLGAISYIGMDWLTKLGLKDFLFITTKKEVDHELETEAGTEESSSTDRLQLQLPDLLHLFTQTETLNPEEAWYCSKCKAHVEAAKTLSLWRLPPIQIVQLKRFIYSANHIWRNKDDRTVIYPHKGLDMAPYLCPGAPPQETNYDLYGVVCHMGSSFFGHYTSYGQLLDAGEAQFAWRCFDDSRVTPSSSSDSAPAQRDAAYLLFYRRRDLASAHLLAPYVAQRPELPGLENRYAPTIAALGKDEASEVEAPVAGSSSLGPTLPPAPSSATDVQDSETPSSSTETTTPYYPPIVLSLLDANDDQPPPPSSPDQEEPMLP